MSTLEDIQAQLADIAARLTEGRDHASSLIAELGNIAAIVANVEELAENMTSSAAADGYEHRLQVLTVLSDNLSTLKENLETVKSDLGTVVGAYNAADGQTSEAVTTAHAVNA